MTKLEKRYQTWGDASFEAYVKEDVEAEVSLWAENCTFTVIDAFGEHQIIQGKAAHRKYVEDWVSRTNNFQILKNEILSASQEKGIGNAIVRWTGSDGNEFSCNFIYMMTLDADNRCTSFAEWNVVKKREQ